MTLAELEHWKRTYPPEHFHVRFKEMLDRADARRRESLRAIRRQDWLTRR